MPDSNFIDYVRIRCASGHGGAGSAHLYHAKFQYKGGPDGGNGGRGGSIILRANPQFWTLIHLKYRKNIIAENGQPGAGSLQTGKSGQDIILDVPLGTVVKKLVPLGNTAGTTDANPAGTGESADSSVHSAAALTTAGSTASPSGEPGANPTAVSTASPSGEPGANPAAGSGSPAAGFKQEAAPQVRRTVEFWKEKNTQLEEEVEYIGQEDEPVPVPVERREYVEEQIAELVDPGQEFVLCKGGRGGLGNNNFKTSTNRTPRYAQPGEPGEEGWFVLELKLLADVGLVGFPNAGKSTLLASITSAKPKIANYAFTTLEPNLGIVKYYDGKSFVMADIPGIIEGAHEGRGIGIRFLRHIERNSVLLFMVSAEEDDIAAGYETLLNELREYNPELLAKDRVLAVTKCDLLDAGLEAEIEPLLPGGVPHVFISSVSGEGLSTLKDMLWRALQG